MTTVPLTMPGQGMVCTSPLLSQFSELLHGTSTRALGNTLDQPARDPEGTARDNLRRLLGYLGTDEHRHQLVTGAITHSNTVGVLREPASNGYGLVLRLPPQDDHDAVHYISRNDWSGVSATPGAPVAGVDALITKTPHLALMLRSADCAPLLLFDPVQKVVALVHVGIAGLVTQIVHHTCEEMETAFGCKPRNLVAAIGPCIGPCCYNLCESGMWQRLVHGMPLGGRYQMVARRPTNFDLPAYIRGQLQSMGIPEAQIEMPPEYTCCSGRFFSNHTAPDKARCGRHATVIALR